MQDIMAVGSELGEQCENKHHYIYHFQNILDLMTHYNNVMPELLLSGQPCPRYIPSAAHMAIEAHILLLGNVSSEINVRRMYKYARYIGRCAICESRVKRTEGTRKGDNHPACDLYAPLQVECAVGAIPEDYPDWAMLTDEQQVQVYSYILRLGARVAP